MRVRMRVGEGWEWSRNGSDGEEVQVKEAYLRESFRRGGGSRK